MRKGGKRRLEGSDDLGQQLRDIRLERGLTQRELATLVGVSPAHVSAIETGKVTNPGIELVERIATVLEARILLGKQPTRSIASPTLAYESPFELEPGPTRIIQSTLQELSDLLGDRAIPIEKRAEIAKQVLSYAKWHREAALRSENGEP